MPLKILLIAFSLLTFGCANNEVRPKPEVCIYHDAIGEFVCYDPKIEKHRRLTRVAADKYICLSPPDFNSALHFLHGLYKEEDNKLSDTH